MRRSGRSSAAPPGSSASAGSCPNLRTIISVPAGLAHMRIAPFLFWSTLGTAVWSSGLAGGGYLLGASFDRIDAVLAPVSTAVIVGGILWYVWRQLTWSRRAR